MYQWHYAYIRNIHLKCYLFGEACASTIRQVWKPEGNFRELFLSFFPSFVWVLGIELRSSGSTASTKVG